MNDTTALYKSARVLHYGVYQMTGRVLDWVHSIEVIKSTLEQCLLEGDDVSRHSHSVCHSYPLSKICFFLRVYSASFSL